MADVDSLLATAAENATSDEEVWSTVSGYETVAYSDDKTILIANKTIGSLSQQISISGEIDSQLIVFEQDRYYDGIDLTTKKLAIHWERDENSEVVGEDVAAVNVKATSNTIQFAWLVPEEVTRYANSFVRLMPYAYSTGTDATKMVYIYKNRYIEYSIEDGLTLTPQTPDDNSEELKQLYARLAY